MEKLFKKLDNLMMNDFVRKLGGLFCLLLLGVSAVAFLIGAGDLLNKGKKTESAVEAEDHAENGDAEDADDEEMDEEELDEDE
ncbi:MAG: hypothetical protein MRK02_05355 [Candidatus Scalindua sp.]|nr:hypothetical protein [Candidatus Scalindua sp.]